MAKLTADQQRFLTLANARFERVKHICQEYKKRFKEEITPQQVSSYNLDTDHGKDEMGQDLKDLFTATRDDYLRDEKTVGGFHRIHRVRELEKLLDHPIVAGSPRLAAEIWKQIAMEEGERFRQQPKGIPLGDALAAAQGIIRDCKQAVKETVADAQLQATVFAAIDAKLAPEDEDGGPQDISAA